MKVDASHCPSPHAFRNKLGRVLWKIVWVALYRPSPKIFHGWRRLLLRTFGARVGKSVSVHPSTRIWAPWKLDMGDHSCLGSDVDCYCVDRVRIGAHATVSQYAFLCTASHDVEDPAMGLTTRPIVIENGAWIAADVFIGPGVTVGEGAVVGARSSVYKDVPPWTIVGGNPARYLKPRTLKCRDARLNGSSAAATNLCPANR